MTRRQFAVSVSGVVGGAAARAEPEIPGCGADSHLGNLCGVVASKAAQSKFDLSYLHNEFRDLEKWQRKARALLLDHLSYSPAPVAPDAQVIARKDRGDHWEESLTFRTAEDTRVPAYVLIPKNAKLPAPGIVALHDHGGFYMWGKEKILDFEGEHPALTNYRKRYYGGKSIVRDLVRRGNVVIVIDMFYWGERRLLLPTEAADVRDRANSITEAQVHDYNLRMGQQLDLVIRSLMMVGVSPAGMLAWDDIRTVDYLASRPEVDPKRIACVGLSVGGYRSYLLAAADPRIRVAVGVGWMASFAYQVPKHVRYTIGPLFHVQGMYRHLDLPDFSALIAPRPLLLINGAQDALFEQAGLKAAYGKIERIYAKAKAGDRQRCRLYDTPHEFNAVMQSEAWAWLDKWLE